MGMDLHPTILSFFHRRMSEHDAVSDLVRLDWDGEFIFQIRRDRYGDTIKVWLTDAYHFTETDFDGRPDCIAAGDFIIVAKPEGNFSVHHEIIRQSRIGVGHIGKFMGAINLKDPWRFLTADERENLKMKRL